MWCGGKGGVVEWYGSPVLSIVCVMVYLLYNARLLMAR